MINLFLNDEGITTYYTEGAELVSSDMLQDLDYIGQECEEYQCADGVFMFISAESHKAMAEFEGIEDVDCHDAWCRVSKNKPILYQEFINSIEFDEEIISLNFNNHMLEAVTKWADIMYLYNNFLNSKDDRVCMLHC